MWRGWTDSQYRFEVVQQGLLRDYNFVSQKNKGMRNDVQLLVYWRSRLQGVGKLRMLFWPQSGCPGDPSGDVRWAVASPFSLSYFPEMSQAFKCVYNLMLINECMSSPPARMYAFFPIPFRFLRKPYSDQKNQAQSRYMDTCSWIDAERCLGGCLDQ